MRKIKVVAALIKHEQKYLIGLRSSGKFLNYWEFPGGKIEPNENPEEALKRELLEEFGLFLNIDGLAFNINHDYDDFQLDMDCFLCRVDNLDRMQLNDHSQIDWFDPKSEKEYRWLPADVKVVEKLRELA